LKLLRTLARISQTHSRNNITFHLVARSEFSSSIEDDLSFRKWAIDVTVDSVYNRVLRRVPLAGTSRLHPTEPNVAFFQAPVFTIARQSQKHVSFTYQYPPPDAGALDESTILHVGYRVSQCRRYVFASVVDERGEEQDVSAWFISCDREAFWQQVVANVWTFALRAASRARVQWTMVMAKLGGIEELELDGMFSQIYSCVYACIDLRVCSMA
jgi:mediator of RNA polymerase II transcription subunit 13